MCRKKLGGLFLIRYLRWIESVRNGGNSYLGLGGTSSRSSCVKNYRSYIN